MLTRPARACRAPGGWGIQLDELGGSGAAPDLAAAVRRLALGSLLNNRLAAGSPAGDGRVKLLHL